MKKSDLLSLMVLIAAALAALSFGWYNDTNNLLFLIGYFVFGSSIGFLLPKIKEAAIKEFFE